MHDDNNADTVIETILTGYQRLISMDKYDIRDAACTYRSIAVDAYNGSDSRAVLNFAVFLRATKLARLQSKHIAEWLKQQSDGERAMKKVLGIMDSEEAHYAY